MLTAKNNSDDMDAKLSSWNPHYKHCWSQYYTKDYQQIVDSDPQLFTILRKVDEEENAAYDGHRGHIIYMLRNLVNYYIDWETSKIKIKDLDRGLYSLHTSSVFVDYM